MFLTQDDYNQWSEGAIQHLYNKPELISVICCIAKKLASKRDFKEALIRLTSAEEFCLQQFQLSK